MDEEDIRESKELGDWYLNKSLLGDVAKLGALYLVQLVHLQNQQLDQG
jgi:hypothetical protein